MTFDGPGRQAALCREGLVLRPDWEAVLAPVADAMIARADVDDSRVAIVGSDLAGFGVTRALAYEQRFAAAVVAPGIVEAARPWLAALPSVARAALHDDDRGAFDRELISLTCLLRGRASDYGAPPRLRRLACRSTTSSSACAPTRWATSSRIATPLLVCIGAGRDSVALAGRELLERLGATGPFRRPGARSILGWVDRAID